MRLYQAMEGFNFISDVSLVLARQIRFPRSKRRRIRRKWARRRDNNEFTPSPSVFYCEAQKTVIAHPATIIALKAKIAESERKHRADLAQAAQRLQTANGMVVHDLPGLQPPV